MTPPRPLNSISQTFLTLVERRLQVALRRKKAYAELPLYTHCCVHISYIPRFMVFTRTIVPTTKDLEDNLKTPTIGTISERSTIAYMCRVWNKLKMTMAQAELVGS